MENTVNKLFAIGFGNQDWATGEQAPARMGWVTVKETAKQYRVIESEIEVYSPSVAKDKLHRMTNSGIIFSTTKEGAIEAWNKYLSYRIVEETKSYERYMKRLNGSMVTA